MKTTTWILGASLLLTACGGSTITPTGDAAPGDASTAETGPDGMTPPDGAVGPDGTVGPDAQLCLVDFPCGPWQRFSCDTDGGYRALESRGCESVCPPGPCSGGVCALTGPTLACPRGTRCVMYQPPMADMRASPCEPLADASVDGAVDVSGDAVTCPLPESAGPCTTDTDCTTLARGCYCGAQPVDGVLRRYAEAAGVCEARNSMNCALGCAVFPGQQAQDGRTVTDGGVVAVRCEQDGGVGRCRTYVRP